MLQQGAHENEPATIYHGAYLLSEGGRIPRMAKCLFIGEQVTFQRYAYGPLVNFFQI